MGTYMYNVYKMGTRGEVKVTKDIPKASLIKSYFFFHLHPIYFKIYK